MHNKHAFTKHNQYMVPSMATKAISFRQLMLLTCQVKYT